MIFRPSSFIYCFTAGKFLKFSCKIIFEAENLFGRFDRVTKVNN